jgi:predicted nucleic acid-binding protein
MPVAPQVFVDASAWVRYCVPQAAQRLDEMAVAGVLATCGLVELQLLGGLPNSEMYDTVATLRQRAFPVLEMTEADGQRALQVQALLVAGGQYSVPWPVLLVAAVAERHGVTVLHANRCFSVVAGTTKQAAEWVVPVVGGTDGVVT